MEPDLSALVQASYEGKPSEFQSITNELLGQRVVAALDRRREEMAQAMLNPPVEDTDDTEIEVEDDPQINSDETPTDSSDTGTEDNNGQDS